MSNNVENLKNKVTKQENTNDVLKSLFGNPDQTEEIKEVDEVKEKTDNQDDQSGSPVVVEEAAATKEENNDNEDGDQTMENLAKEIQEILKDDNNKKTAKPEMVGIYFDTDVKRALDKYQKDNGRGAKSDLLNKLARLALTQKGYLK